MNPAHGDLQAIDLCSDDEDLTIDDDLDSGRKVDSLPERQQRGNEVEEDWERNYGGLGIEGAAQPGSLEVAQDWDPNVIDLVRPRPDPAPAVNPESINPAPNNPMYIKVDLTEGELVTAAACLQMVVDILPDISVDHVLALIADQTQDHTRTLEACQRIITHLLDGGAYPKEEEEVGRKRKRERSLSEFEDDDGDGRSESYKIDAVDLLRDEFVHVPVRHIERVIKEHKTLYKAYGIIEDQLRHYSQNTPFTKVLKERPKRGVETILVGRGSQIPKELQAAKKKCEEAATKRCKAEDASREEEDNLRQAVLAGEMTECQCCFDDLPINRMIGCGGATIHFLCRECVKNYVESEMGSSRCRPVCFADSKCGGSFTRSQLQDCLADTSFDRLEHMQQMQDLEIAGLDLDECPFCDFKQECPPVDEDKEFRCLNPKCRKTSCRLCQKETHIPLSCQEAKKNEKLTVRHIVEEAMTAALIRNCNSCKRPFIKEFGCNKMSCSHCGNQQCYVCSKDIKNYTHFSDQNSGRTGCQLHDNVEDRHEQEVKKAAEEAMAKAKSDNPGLSDADLMIEVSDRVKQTEQQRLNRALPVPQGLNFLMRENVIRQVAHPAAQVAAPAPAPVVARPQQQQYAPQPQIEPLAAIAPHGQHIFLHEPQIFRQAQFNFAFPAPQANFVPQPFQQLPVNPGPAQRPWAGVIPLHPLQAPHPQQQPGAGGPNFNLANARLQRLQELVGMQQAQPAAQPQERDLGPETVDQIHFPRAVIPGYVPFDYRRQEALNDRNRALRAEIVQDIARRRRERVQALARRPPPAGGGNLLD